MTGSLAYYLIGALRAGVPGGITNGGSSVGSSADTKSFALIFEQLKTSLAGHFDGFFDRIAKQMPNNYVYKAFLVAIFVSLCASLLGVSLVLKRLSFIGDGLSHVAFGAKAVAIVLGIVNEMTLIMPLTVIAAVFLIKGGKKRKIKGDAGLAMLSVGSLGMGYLLLNVFSTNTAGDVCSTLFGTSGMYTLKNYEFWTCIICSLVVIAVFILLYNKIFAVTFDESFAEATGTRAGVYNMVIAVITAVIIVISMKAVGSLLISAFIVFPALSAMRVFKSFRGVSVCSVVIALFCSVTGFIIAVGAKFPTGLTIVAVNIIVFAVFSLTGLIKRKA